MRIAAVALFAVPVATGIVLAAGSLSAQAQSQPQSQAQTGPASAQTESAKPIGKVVTSSGGVTIEHGSAVVVQASLGGPQAVKPGDPVFMGDIVQTAADGKIGVTFADGTAFNLASNARMVLNEFVYDPNGKSNSTLFSLTKGTFTFVAGRVAKTGDMKIDTPVATMGIRGTTPHVEISDDGTVRFSTLLEDGKDKVMDHAGNPIKQANARNASNPAPTEADRAVDKKLKICIGC
jgi:hypothetical protein